MNMKIKFIIPALAFALAIVSCNPDRLDIPQQGRITTDTFYQNDEDAEAAMVAAYQGFLWNVCTKEGGNIYAPYRAAFNLCGDDMYAAGESFGDNDYMAALNEFRYDSGSEVIRNAYNNLYYAMYYSNLVIDHFKDGDTPVQKRVTAEARVLRAWMHMMLAIGWGTPPLVDHVLQSKDNPYNCNTSPDNPMSHDELLLWCAKECEDAVADLDERKDKSDKDGAVKVTKGFAWAVAGKARLFAKDYAGAKKDLFEVIKSNKYDLVPGDRYWENFHLEGDCNEEKIFEANIELNSNISVFWDIVNRSTWMEANIWGWRSDHFVAGADPCSAYTSIEGWGGCGVPQSFADEFVANDGPDSYRIKATIVPIEDAIYNTVYGNDKIDGLTLEEKMASKDLGINIKGLYGQSFYLPLKQLARKTDLSAVGQNVRVNNFVIMRYAEVLLMYAEACVQSGDAASALPYIQKIQTRAGSKTVSSAVTMDVVKREKKLEMWLEGCRWPDMVRWGDTKAVESAGQAVPVLYDKFTRMPDPKDEGLVWHKDGRFYTVLTHKAIDRGDKVGFVAGKHEVFPFPVTVTSVNDNITQNPNW